MDEINDLDRIPESEMVRRWYSNGEQPQTSPPIFVPICNENPGIQSAIESATLTGPAALQLHCATQGASDLYSRRRR